MADPDDHNLETATSARSSVFNVSSSAWHGEHSFRSESQRGDDYDELLRAAMQKAAEHPDAHRMAVVPTQAKSQINLLDVNKLTRSKKKLVVTRALDTSGQDNERLLQKIRARQDRYKTWCIERAARLAIAARPVPSGYASDAADAAVLPLGMPAHFLMRLTSVQFTSHICCPLDFAELELSGLR